jgi:hypothetical protein
MNIYPVLNTSVISDTVSLFLGQTGLKPPLPNPTTLVPKLIQCKGIIHYTRSGTRTVVTSENHKLKDGDFLVVAKQCKTGANYTIPVTFQKTDYAFIMGKRDSFFTNAQNYMNRRPSVINRSKPKRNTITKAVTTRSSFDDILEAVVEGKEIATPINDILIVSHARGEGMLFFKLNAGDKDKVIYLDELCPFTHSKTRTQITKREVEDHKETHIHIRGCNIGKEIKYLQFIKKIFGTNVTVTAPKHIDFFGYFSDPANSIDIKYEYMKYCFTVYQKKKVKDRNALVQLFDNKSLSDIHGKAFTTTQWKSWIPSSIHTASAKPTYTCNNPVNASMRSYIKREYRYRYKKVFTFTIRYQKGVSPPSSKSDRISVLKQSLKSHKNMQAQYPSKQCPFPEYMRHGYTSVDDMVDNLYWTISWSSSKRILIYLGRRREYQVRIPITDANNNLMLNAVPSTGNRQYTHNNILETDTRFFASA